MKELGRTLAFVVAAAVGVLAAAGMHWASRPAPRAEADVLGKPFFKDFDDPTKAQGLKVVLYDEDTASIKEFEVALKDGKWRIPSHHDYPADGKDRLARTAASVMEIKKAGLASPREADHARFNVLDPMNQELTVLKGRGQRVTLTGEGGAVLADYIIGKKVEKRDGYYYVRNPKEKQTYLAKVEINLSTKFADWIEADLLKLDAEKLAAVDIEKYSVDRTRGEIVNQELSKLTRKSSSDPWTLDGLNAETEELKVDEVRTLVNNLDDLKIVGVRPKPPGLRPDLTVEAKVGRNPLAMQALKSSLINKGFLPTAGPDGNAKLVSTEGAVIASTTEGVEYVLNFGEVFTGSDLEIESGFAKDDDGKSADAGGSDKKEEAKADGAKKDEGKDESAKDEDEEDDAGADVGKDADTKSSDKKPSDKKPSDKKKGELKKSRYLMVLVQFDESRLGPEPVKPEKPEPGDAPAAEKPDAAKPDAAKPDAAKPEAEKKEPAKPEDGKKDEAKKDEAKPGESNQDEDEEQDAAKDDAPAKKEEAKKDDAGKPEASKPDAKKEDGKAEGGKAEDGATKEPEKKDPEKKNAEKKDPPFEAKLAEYQRELEKYENDVKLRDDKIEKGRKQVDQLNKRFGPWYYVISAESFDSLRLARASLVKTKEPPPGDKKDGDKPDGEKKDEPKPEGDKPEEKKPETKPDEKKPDAKE